MKKEFSTFDIARLLNINRARIQEWIDSGYIRPSIQSATGKGRRALFSREDLYQIHAFHILTEMHFHRNLARDCSFDISFQNVGPDEKDFKYAEVKMGRIPNPYTFMIKKETKISKAPSTTQLKENEYVACIINLLAIKEEVDRLLDNV